MAQITSEERFRAFMTASSEVIYRMSPDWSEMRHLVGREFIADTLDPSSSWLQKYIHPDDQPQVQAAIREAIRTKSVFELEHRVVRADGTLGWTLSRAIPVLTDTGEIVEWFGAASNITARKQAEQALSESQELMATHLAGMRRLYDLHARLAHETDRDAALDEILRAACDFTGTDRGCVQLVADDGQRLEMIAQRGYGPRSPFVEHFRHQGSEVACDTTRRHRQRLIIEDVETYEPLAGTKDRQVALADGIRAAQSTPMVTRTGEMVGVLSTQFRKPHRPAEHELRLIDLLAWTAAEFVERRRADDALRRVSERQAFLLKLSDALRPLADPAAIQGEAARLLREHFDVGWCFYAEVDQAGEVVTILRDATRAGLPSLAGRHDVSDIPEYIDFLRTGQLVNVPDIANYDLLSPRIVEQYTALGVRAMLAVLLVKEDLLLSQLVMFDTIPRRWPEEAVELIRDVAERTWAAALRVRAEAALRESEQRLQLATETTELAVFEWDLASDRVAGNDRLCQLFGIGPDEPIAAAQILRERIHPEDLEFVGAQLQKAMNPASSGRYTFEYRLAQPKAHGERWLLTFGQVYFEGAGTERKAVRVLGTNLDITQRKRTEAALCESEERTRRAHDLLEGITEATDDLVSALDTDFRFIAFNTAYQKAFEQIFGRRLDVGTSLIDATAHLPDDQRRAVALWGRALAGETVFETQEFGDPQRARRSFDLRLGPIRDAAGAIIGAGGFASDVTERVQGEQALREAKRQLEEADRRKNDFLAVLSHELRNPLTPIANSLHILDHAEPGEAKAQRAKQVLGRQVAQLAHLVNDLLDVTRITRNKIQLQKEHVDLREVVRRAVEDHRTVFEHAGVRLELSPDLSPVPVFADRTRVAQVVGNLLQNSAKFTSAGGHTRVAVTAEGSEAVVRVVDDGVGISRETLERMFQPFAQAEQTLDRAQGGLGIGLSLVKGLIELHGGSVSAHSEGLGHGTEFVVQLPLDRISAREPAIGHAHPSHPRWRVLIIEDNADAADSLRDLLELEEHEVAVAYNGPEGIATAKEFRPEVVLCDIGLPGMNGYEIARVLRADETLRGTFLVALSGYAQPEDLKRAAEAGFDNHLAKPPCLEKLDQLLADPRRRETPSECVH